MGDGSSGRIMNILPKKTLETGHRVVPIVMKLNDYVVKANNIDFNKEGVDEFGNLTPGSEMIRREYPEVWIDKPIYLGINDSYIFVKCALDGTETDKTREIGQYIQLINKLESEKEILKLQAMQSNQELRRAMTEKWQNVRLAKEISDGMNARSERIIKEKEDADEEDLPDEDDN